MNTRLSPIFMRCAVSGYFHFSYGDADYQFYISTWQCWLSIQPLAAPRPVINYQLLSSSESNNSAKLEISHRLLWKMAADAEKREEFRNPKKSEEFQGPIK